MEWMMEREVFINMRSLAHPPNIKLFIPVALKFLQVGDYLELK